MHRRHRFGLVAACDDQVPTAAAVLGELLAHRDDHRGVGETLPQLLHRNRLRLADDTELSCEVSDGCMNPTAFYTGAALLAELEQFGHARRGARVGKQDHAERRHAACAVGPFKAVAECPAALLFPFLCRNELSAHGNLVDHGHRQCSPLGTRQRPAVPAFR